MKPRHTLYNQLRERVHFDSIDRVLAAVVEQSWDVDDQVDDRVMGRITDRLPSGKWGLEGEVVRR